MANDRTMMPMPPIQWVRLRQNRMPRGRDSMSERMLAPVVVKPDMVSKKASVKEGMAEMRKGRQPNSEREIQAKVTMANPCLGCKSRSRRRVVMTAINPQEKQTAALMRKAE